ncbi:MAG: YbaB/EbfC family nucleoid-associated protein [Candidatus Uhrbacteria bacterium]|nr:YbaB/EbfC family nucleoid-associated protein [Candidatus Uhrbacteria bacterium]
MFNKLKQFKDLRSRAKDLQEALSKESSEGSAAWGKVKVVIDGTQNVQSVSIDPSLTDIKAIEQGVKDAVNDAMKKMQRTLASKMNDLGGSDLAQEMQELLGKK